MLSFILLSPFGNRISWALETCILIQIPACFHLLTSSFFFLFWQSCKSGYYRSHVGSYLGKCIKCDCHGHSRDNYCDPETGECKVSGYSRNLSCQFKLKTVALTQWLWDFCFLLQNCQHNTDGFRCQNCLTGFYGNATIGKPLDCKPCPCPMTSPPNR